MAIDRVAGAFPDTLDALLQSILGGIAASVVIAFRLAKAFLLEIELIVIFPAPFKAAEHYSRAGWPKAIKRAVDRRSGIKACCAWDQRFSGIRA